MTVCFLGLGVMGSGMASSVLNAGLPLAVWNRHRERAAPFAARGARVAETPRDAAAGADIVVAMVADDKASRSVWTDADGALAGMKRGAVAIESSTLSPAWIEELFAAVAYAGGTLLDAPVTGSKTHAAKGELRFLVGGPADALDRARPALNAMGKEILHLGPSGAGARMKLINNFVCGAQAAALAEGLALAERSGLGAAATTAVLANGAPGSPLVNAVAPRMTGKDYTVNFSLNLMHKDLTYAIADAVRFGLDLRTAATARALFGEALAAGWGDKDFASVIEALRAREEQ
jgi:3-hydroxyisobutyrate dehydrogenase